MTTQLATPTCTGIRSRRRRLITVPAAAGIAFVAAWVTGLLVWPSNLDVAASDTRVVSAYAGHQGVASAQYLLVEGLAAIDLDGVGEQFARRQYHRAAQLVQPRPRRLVAAQPEDALQAQRRDALFLIDHVPDRGEPAHQRRPGAGEGEDRGRRDRRLRATGRAATQPVRHLPPAAIDRSAEPAAETAAPPQSLQVALARPIVGEPRQQLMPVARVVQTPPADAHQPHQQATRRRGRKRIAHSRDCAGPVRWLRVTARRVRA